MVYPIEPYSREDRSQKEAYHENRHRGRSLAYSRASAVHRVASGATRARSLSEDATRSAVRKVRGDGSNFADEADSPAAGRRRHDLENDRAALAATRSRLTPVDEAAHYR